jgi:type IV pilus assembly protein PilP
MGTIKGIVSVLFFLLIGVGVIPLSLGISSAQTGKKAVLKIPKEETKLPEPSQKPAPDETEAEKIETEVQKKKEEAPYSYDPTDKVDPFKSFITVREELEEKEAREKPRTYLETLDISQLTISAIVLTSGEHWALVRDSKGDGHVVKIGTPIGRKGGRVTEILEDKVVVREYHKDIRGREIVRDHVLRLPSLE